MEEQTEILDKGSLKNKTAKGLFWGGFSNLIQQVVGMVFGLIIARILSPDDYGLIAMLGVFSAFASIVLDAGFVLALINQKKIEHNDYNAVFWFNVFIGIGCYLLLFFSAPLIAQFYKQPILIPLSRMIFLGFLVSSFGVSHNAMLIRNLMVKQRGIIDIAAVVCSGITGVFLAWKGYAFWGLAVQQVVQYLIQVILRWVFSSWRPSFPIDFTPLRRLFRFGSMVFITAVVSAITNNLLSVLLGRYYGKTLTGYYAQGSKWGLLFGNIIHASIGNIAQPVFVEANSDKKRQLNVFRKMVRFGAFVSFPAFIGLAFIGEEFIIITLGEKWRDSLFFLQLFCLWGLNSYLWVLYTMLLLAHEKAKVYMSVMVSLFSVQLFALVLGAAHLPIQWLLGIYVALFSISTIFIHVYVSRKLIDLRVRDVIHDMLPYAMTTAVAVGIAWLFSYSIEAILISLVVKVLSVAFVYVILLKLFGSVLLNESLSFIKQKTVMTYQQSFSHLLSWRNRR